MIDSRISFRPKRLAIAAALVRLGKRISQLPDEDLRRGLRLTTEQPWLDERTKALLAEALKEISGGKA